MIERRSCGCVVPDEAERVPCAAHDPSMAETAVTHIRQADAFRSLCGLDRPSSSVSRAHVRQQASAPAIAGQLRRLPAPLCPACLHGVNAAG